MQPIVRRLWGRVEKSLFECSFTEASFNEFLRRLRWVIDPSRDRVIIYRLCESCRKEVRVFGPVSRPDDAPYYFV